MKRLLWSKEENNLLREEYKKYGDAERLQSRLRYRNIASIIKQANKLGLTTRRPELTPYSLEELRSNTKEDERNCWNWMGDKRPAGYGVVIHDGQRIAAHRLAFSLANPHININAWWILHRCDNPACINPEHLYLGDVRDNVKDMISRGRGANQYGRWPRESM